MEDAAMLSPRTGRLGVLWIFGDYGCGEDAMTIIATSSTVAVPIKHVRSSLLPQRYHVWNDQSPCSLLSQPIA